MKEKLKEFLYNNESIFDVFFYFILFIIFSIIFFCFGLKDVNALNYNLDLTYYNSLDVGYQKSSIGLFDSQDITINLSSNTINCNTSSCVVEFHYSSSFYTSTSDSYTGVFNISPYVLIGASNSNGFCDIYDGTIYCSIPKGKSLNALFIHSVGAGPYLGVSGRAGLNIAIASSVKVYSITNVNNTINDNTDKVIDSIQGDDVNTNDIPDRQDDTLNKQDELQNSLTSDDIDLENNVKLNTDAKANTLFWDILTKLINTHQKVVQFVISCLSIGLIKLILGR